MIDIILTSLAISFVALLGFSIIKYFSLWSEADNLSIAAVSYGLGVGLISMQLYIYSRIGLQWSRELIMFPWFMLMLFVFINNIHSLSKFKIPKFNITSGINLILLFFIIAAASYTFFEALIRPVSVWDAVAIWMNKSKIFYFDQSITTNLLYLFDFGYPLVVSLFGTFIYIILGHINDSAVLLTSFAFYFFTALLLFSTIKKRFGLTYALIFTFLFVTTQNFVRHGGRMEAGQADLPLGYYTFVCLILLLDYFKQNKAKLLSLLSIYLGITGLIKSEALFITIAIVIPIIYQIYKTKHYNHLIILFFWVLPIIDWQLYKNDIAKPPNFYPFYQNILSWQRVVNTLLGMVKEFINIKSWNMLWIVYFYSFLIVKIKNKKELIIINTIILSQIFIYFLIYILNSAFNPESSAERLYVHIAPLVFFYLAIVFWKLIDLKDLRKSIMLLFSKVSSLFN